MIGVIADAADQEVAREFFELFKTPWEFYQTNRQYEVLLCAGGVHTDAMARLVLVYAGNRSTFDDELGISTVRQRTEPCTLACNGSQIPLYGQSVSFAESADRLLANEASQECVGFVKQSRGGVFARIGYDLFSEIRYLLTAGQPASNASLPTLECHIEFLRKLIARYGVSLTEIPPVPAGYRFIACLTHDVDHPLIRRHKWDHTMFGFLFRAVFSSFTRFVRGKLPGRDLLSNWLAALKLPLVHLGLAKDFWSEFADKYLELEKDLPSTFFVIPFKDYPGKNQDDLAPQFRASRYGARDIAGEMNKLQARGREIGLHGIDAWTDSSKGQEELEEVVRPAESSETGVRMHWLYFDQQSPVALESAGATYDSTMGYNETVGYRAGTTQAYKPLGVDRLLELPLHAMDTALFYPSYLNLSELKAKALLSQMAENAARFGGALTINWHDRSLAPERLWNECYRDLLEELKSRGAWFATAGQAVSWFRKRRSAVFGTDDEESVTVRAQSPVNDIRSLPGLLLRTHRTANLDAPWDRGLEVYIDEKIDEGAENRRSQGINL